MQEQQDLELQRQAIEMSNLADADKKMLQRQMINADLDHSRQLKK